MREKSAATSRRNDPCFSSRQELVSEETAMCGLQRTVLACVLLLSTVAGHGCSSGPVPVGKLVLAKVVGCDQPDEVFEKRLKYWRGVVEAGGIRAAIFQDWERESRGLLQKNSGVLVDLEIEGIAVIRLNRELGKPKEITVDSWRTVELKDRVFAETMRTGCSEIRIGRSQLYLITRVGSEGVPPNRLPDFLGVSELFPMPEFFKSFVVQ